MMTTMENYGQENVLEMVEQLELCPEAYVPHVRVHAGHDPLLPLYYLGLSGLWRDLSPERIGDALAGME